MKSLSIILQKPRLKRIFAWVAVFLMCFSVYTQTSSALSQKQLQQFQNHVYYYNVDECENGGGDDGSSSISGETTGPPKAVQQVIWDTLTSSGIDDMHTAAVLGNLYAEGGDPMNVGYYPNNTRGKDPTTSKAHDEGYGLMGWTPGSYLLDAMKTLGIDGKPYTAETQAAVIVGHIQGKTPTLYPADVGKRFLATKNIEDATTAFQGTSSQKGFENPLDPVGSLGERIKKAKGFLREFGGSSSGSSSSSVATASDSGRTACCNAGSSGGETSLSGSNNEEKVWNYFKSKGLADHLVAGIMGNISQESGFDPENIQDPEGRTKDPSGLSGGWGLIQWTPGSKVLDLAKQAGVDGEIYELKTQLDIIWWHLTDTSPTGVSNAIKEFKKATNPKDAASAWEELIEGAGEPMMENRWAAAQTAMEKYGGTSGGGGTTSSGGGVACQCDSSDSTTVVLDPGHSGSTVVEDKDPSGIIAEDYYNKGETEDMWKVSEIITKKLEDKGFNVVNTKKSANDSVGLIERAKIANNANAAIAVSLHSTPGKFGSKSVGWVTPQEVGAYRQTGSNKKTFSDEEVAKTSQEYANKIVAERKKSEGDATIHSIDFSGRGLPSTGNIPIVQLFSKVPWVYNEVGQTGFNADKYAEGIAQGIISSLGESSDGSSAGCTVTGNGDLNATVLSYAWPDYKGSGYTTPKPEYRQAVKKAQSEGRYVGGEALPGIDCGGFVTLAMVDSGYEPGYNYKGKGGYTGGSSSDAGTQWGWLGENWEQINPSSTKDLQPGDVAINGGHTYMYVGKINGFNSVIASASLDSRAPMAGQEAPADPAFSWYRKK